MIINAGTAGGFSKKGAAIGDPFLCTHMMNHDRRIPIPGFMEYGIGSHIAHPSPNTIQVCHDSNSISSNSSNNRSTSSKSNNNTDDDDDDNNSNNGNKKDNQNDNQNNNTHTNHTKVTIFQNNILKYSNKLSVTITIHTYMTDIRSQVWCCHY